jgi:glyoxalase family protein
MPPTLGGLHHVTAISARIRDNVRFYTGTLGMRLVKKSINQDDVSAYHLFYADGHGSAGSDLTFFDWPVPPEQRGTRAIVRTGLRVAGQGTLEWWHDRLRTAGVRLRDIEQCDGRASLAFEDGEGQRLVLIDDGGAEAAHPWAESPVPPARQIRGLGPVVISVPRLEPTERMLSGALGMTRARSWRHDGIDVHVFSMGPGGPAAELHVVAEPGAPVARQGAGAVHHVAFRVADRAALTAWTKHIGDLGIASSGEVERYYFRSLYFREPGGVLFELATDGPGFAVDEPEATLGTRLSIPPFMEHRRAEIEAGLKPL